MEENKHLYPISEELFNQKIVRNRRPLHLERSAAQSITLQSVLRDTV
jgi:hypothetical protein